MPGEVDPPLCVDLDGTLFRGDSFRHSLATLLRRSPWLLPVVALFVLRGRAAVKRFVATRVLPDPARLRWRGEVVAFVRGERARGRRVILTTAADRLVADHVATYLGCIDEVVASDGSRNLKGRTKLETLLKLLQDKEFDYIGDSRNDLPLFRVARWSFLVDPAPGLRRTAERQARVVRVFEARS
jgi:phosphoserine phosphatase